MSWRVANECADRRFGSAARKQIIMFLADKASDDGSGIWCSKGTIQHHARLAAWVRDRSPMCKHITTSQVTALVAAGLVTGGQLRAAGLAA